MESIIRDAMVKHLLENDLCTTEQHGFTNGRSCLKIKCRQYPAIHTNYCCSNCTISN